MANITDDDDIVEELHSGLVGAPSLHLHLAKYVTEGGNSVSEYRRAVGRLQDSARCEGDMPSALPPPSRHRPPFRKSTRGRAYFSDARQGTSTPTNTPTVVSAREPSAQTQAFPVFLHALLSSRKIVYGSAGTSRTAGMASIGIGYVFIRGA